MSTYLNRLCDALTSVPCSVVALAPHDDLTSLPPPPTEEKANFRLGDVLGWRTEKLSDDNRVRCFVEINVDSVEVNVGPRSPRSRDLLPAKRS